MGTASPIASAAHPHTTTKLSSLLRRANRIVRARYPRAQFHLASGRPAGGSGTSAASVQQWTFLFAVAKAASCRSGATVTISYKSGAFSQPLIVCRPLLDSVKIRLPLHRGLRNALHLLHRAGYRGAFTSVSVYFPSTPTIHEPFYVFALAHQQGAVYVGINSGRVTTNP
jgi:hypothetical protein